MSIPVKYEVFVGSPKKDLAKQREKIIHAVLNMGHIPSGMELWTASTAPTPHDIERKLKHCDVHVIVLGWQYGSIVPGTEKSYTEWEFELSDRSGRPVLAFLLDDRAFQRVVGEKNVGQRVLRPLKAFRQKLKKRAICKMYSSAAMTGIDVDVVTAIQEARDEGRLPAVGGWVRAETESIRMLNDLQRNRFLRKIVERVYKFRTLTSRFERETVAKDTLAESFWAHKFSQIDRAGYHHLFFESGTTLVHVADAFEKRTKDLGFRRSKWTISSNNAVALQLFQLFTNISATPNPQAAPDPDDPYGAIFHPTSREFCEPPPTKPRALYDKEEEVIAETARLLKTGRTHQLFLATASGWDSTCAVTGFRGPHVGSHPNMLFKKAIFRTGCPVVLFLTRRKVDPRFREARFQVGRCYPIFGKETPLRAVLSSYPLAICVGCERDPDNPTSAPKTSEMIERLHSVLAPILKGHNFDLEYAESAYEDRGAFIAANANFMRYFPKT